jgi:hypothetical protein
MAQYFFKMSQAEKNNILDQHKSLYDGFVTQYAQGSNQKPLYVQDFANDKNGITVSNKGVVKNYTNMNINEDINRTDRISDGPHDLKNGTVDFRGTPDMSDVNREYFHDTYPSPGYDDEYISLGINDDEDDEYKDLSMYNPYYSDDEEEECKHCDDDSLDVVIDFDELGEEFEYDIDELEDYLSQPIEDYLEDELNIEDPEEKEKFVEKLNESLDMFRRFKNYN